MAGSIMLRMPAAPDGRQAFILKTLVDVVPPTTDATTHYSTDPGLAVLAIKFQDGPIGEVGANGCQIEDVLAVLSAHLQHADPPRVPRCQEYAIAIEALVAHGDRLQTEADAAAAAAEVAKAAHTSPAA